MGIKERRGNPELLKLGLGLILSLGGIVFTFLNHRRVKSPDANLPGEGGYSKLKKDHHQYQDDDSGAEDSSPNALHDPSSSNKDGFLLPEFDLLVEAYSMGDEAPCRVNWPCPVPVAEAPEGDMLSEEKEDGNRIRNLENKVMSLEAREKVLERQLLEFYGFKEQEMVIKELQDRLRVHNSEAKVYQLKIESLQECNRKLEARVADYTKVVMELEEAKAMLKVLRKKLRSEAHQNREQILNLQERVMKMQEEQMGDRKNVANLDAGSDETRELEMMKKDNENLKMENSQLASELEKMQILATSALDKRRVEELERENGHLAEQNKALNEEIERLQTDRCADVEELVYLRWVNACLRYELRHYQPNPGETTAKDLGRTLSPKSEDNAKRLILEYAMREGAQEKALSFDCSQWHPDMLPSAELSLKKPDSSRHSTVFAKLAKIWRERDNRDHDQKPADDSIVAGEVINLKTPGASSLPSHRSSFDHHGSDSGWQMSSTSDGSTPFSRRTSEDHDLTIFRKISSVRGSNDSSSTAFPPQEDSKDSFRDELVKYAEALEISHPMPPARRRSVQFSSF